MTKRYPNIPAEIDAELSPKARKLFHDLIDDYERRFAELNKRIAGLEEKLQKLTPKNSSIPPSTQHPHAKEKPNPKKRKVKTRKKQGGQPGHPRTTRPLVPTKDCDEVKTLRPRQCRKCNARLKGKDPEPLRHQVIELPEIKPIVTEYQQHLNCNKRLIGMCKELYKHRSWRWTFTEIEGIEPTNNTAERALRPAVIYRKLSFGTQSASGSRFIERILTVSKTCRLQNRSPFQYLVAAMKAHFSQQTPPSLLPTEETAPTKKAA